MPDLIQSSNFTHILRVNRSGDIRAPDWHEIPLEKPAADSIFDQIARGQDHIQLTKTVQAYPRQFCTLRELTAADRARLARNSAESVNARAAAAEERSREEKQKEREKRELDEKIRVTTDKWIDENPEEWARVSEEMRLELRGKWDHVKRWRPKTQRRFAEMMARKKIFAKITNECPKNS